MREKLSSLFYTPKLNKLKWIAQSHIVNQLSQDLKPSSLALEPVLLAIVLYGL